MTLGRQRPSLYERLYVISVEHQRRSDMTLYVLKFTGLALLFVGSFLLTIVSLSKGNWIGGLIAGPALLYLSVDKLFEHMKGKP